MQIHHIFIAALPTAFVAAATIAGPAAATSGPDLTAGSPAPVGITTHTTDLVCGPDGGCRITILEPPEPPIDPQPPFPWPTRPEPREPEPREPESRKPEPRGEEPTEPKPSSPKPAR